MTDIEIAYLETLLNKLVSHIGQRIVIITGVGIDGFELGSYNSAGMCEKTSVCATLKEAIEKIKE